MNNKIYRELSLLLQLWQQQQEDSAEPAQRAQALCDILTRHPLIEQALFFTWHADTKRYRVQMESPQLPPFLHASAGVTDTLLRAELRQKGYVELPNSRLNTSRLISSLKRSEWHYGLLAPFRLHPNDDSVIALATGAAAESAPLLYLLTAFEHLALSATKHSYHFAMSSAEPLPSALCTHTNGAIQQANQAFFELAKLEQLPFEACLPANHKALAQACYQQRRAIENVEASAGTKLFLWSYIPLNNHEVLVRGTDATDALTKEREATKARRLYRLITENTTDLISRHLPDGTFLDASPASWSLLGYWPEELRHNSVADLFHPKDLKQLAQGAALALQQLGYHTMTYRLRHKAGHYLWFETASRAIRDTYTGAVVEIVSVSRDITERVQAEENRRRLAEVVEINTDIVLFVNLQGAVTYANKAARSTLRLQPESLSSLADVFDENTFQAIQQEGWKTAVRRGSWNRDANITPLQGSASIPVSLVLLAHKSAGGERYFSLIMRDMTERALREAEQRQYQEDKAHSARLIALGEVTSAIAHEMNQPLAAIANFAAACQRHLKQNAPTSLDKVAQGLDHIGHQAHHASEVISRLRTFLRKGKRHLEPLNLSQVLSDTVALCLWELERENVKVRYIGEHKLPPVYADRTLLEQVLLNLIRNALEANVEKHERQGSTIIIELQHNNKKATVAIHDQGPGSDEQTLAKMFNPFFTSKEKGLGLGLSMSRTIIEGFGGDLTAQPSPFGGLVLRCTLPLVPTQQETQ